MDFYIMKWPPKKQTATLTYQSFCWLAFILNAPEPGNTPSDYALNLIGISPPAGSPQGALLCCDGSRSALGLDASIIIPSAGHRRRWMCVPSSEPGGQTSGVRSCSLPLLTATEGK